MRDELTLKQHKAIAELMIQPTMAGAAKAVGISYMTLSRWMNDPIFNQEYKRMRDKAVECALSKIQNFTNKSVEALIDLISNEETNDGVKVNAIKLVLDTAVKARANDHAIRLDELEQIIKTGKGTVYDFE